MAPITRRRFIQQTALTAATLYAHPVGAFADGPGNVQRTQRECASARSGSNPQAGFPN